MVLDASIFGKFGAKVSVFHGRMRVRVLDGVLVSWMPPMSKTSLGKPQPWRRPNSMKCAKPQVMALP